MQHCDLEMLRNQTGIDYVMHPTFLVNFLSEYMFRLLSMDYYTASYGGFLYESIGTITFLLDGELHVKYNLSEKYVHTFYESSSAIRRLDHCHQASFYIDSVLVCSGILSKDFC